MALTSRFIAAVRRQGSIPSSFLDADILDWADIEVQDVFIPLLESCRSNYLIREITLTPVNSRAEIPMRSVGAALRSVQALIGNTWSSLPQRAMEEVDYISSGYPAAYFVDAGSIRLLPTGTSVPLRVRYAMRPGRMALETDSTRTQRISAVANVAGVVTLTLAGAFTGGLVVDVLSAGPAHQQKLIDGALVGPASSYFELPNVGDYVAMPEFSPFVPIPEELFAALVHRTAGVILRALGYDGEASAQLNVAEEAIDRSRPMLTPRNEGNPPIIKGGIRKALMQAGRFGRWR